MGIQLRGVGDVASLTKRVPGIETKLARARRLIVQAMMFALEKKYDDAYPLLKEVGGIIDEVRVK